MENVTRTKESKDNTNVLEALKAIDTLIVNIIAISVIGFHFNIY